MMRLIQAMTNCGLQCRLRFDGSTGTVKLYGVTAFLYLGRILGRELLLSFTPFQQFILFFFWINQPCFIGFVRVLIFYFSYLYYEKHVKNIVQTIEK